MTLRKWLRNLISGPPRINDRTDDAGDVEATLSQEFDTQAPSDAVVKGLAAGSHLLPNAEGAEVAVDDLETMEAPADLDP